MFAVIFNFAERGLGRIEMSEEKIEVIVTWDTGVKTSRVISLEKPFVIAKGVVLIELRKYTEVPATGGLPAFAQNFTSTADYMKKIRE